MKSQVWDLLHEQGIAEGEQPENDIVGSPWYVKTLLAFSGWLAAIFILGFVGFALQFVVENSAVAGMFGAMMVAGAFLLLRSPDNEFVEHLGLAVSMAGQALIIFAIFNLANHNETTAWLLFAILEVALVVLMSNFVHCVVSALVAAIALSMALLEMHIPYVVGGIVLFGASFCWLNEFRYLHQIQKIRASGYGLVLALIALKGTTLFGYRTFGRLFFQKQAWGQAWIGELMIGAVALYVVWSLLQHYDQPVKGRLSIATLVVTVINLCGIDICSRYYCWDVDHLPRVLLCKSCAPRFRNYFSPVVYLFVLLPA